MTRTQLNEFTFYSRLSSPLFFITIIILNKLFWPFICIQRFSGNSLLYKVHRGFWFVPFFVWRHLLCAAFVYATLSVEQQQLSDGSKIALVLTFAARVFTCPDERASDRTEDKRCQVAPAIIVKRKKIENFKIKKEKKPLYWSVVYSLCLANPTTTSLLHVQVQLSILKWEQRVPWVISGSVSSPSCDFIWPRPRRASPSQTPLGRCPACCACGRSSLCKTRRKMPGWVRRVRSGDIQEGEADKRGDAEYESNAT